MSAPTLGLAVLNELDEPQSEVVYALWTLGGAASFDRLRTRMVSRRATADPDHDLAYAAETVDADLLPALGALSALGRRVVKLDGGRCVLVLPLAVVEAWAAGFGGGAS